MTDVKSDALLICEWMGWEPWHILDLDALREVEQRLNHGGQITLYISELLRITLAPDQGRYDWQLIDATAAQKVAALAAVIRGIE